VKVVAWFGKREMGMGSGTMVFGRISAPSSCCVWGRAVSCTIDLLWF